MKRIVLVIVAVLLLAFHGQAQTTLFSEAIQPNVPCALELIGDDLYVGTLAAESLLQKIDLSNPDEAILIHDFDAPTGIWKMAYHAPSNSIYAYVYTFNTLYRFDLDQSPPITPEFVLNPNALINGMVMHGDLLIYSQQSTTPFSDSIYSYNVVTGDDPVFILENPIEDGQLRNLRVYQDEIYYSNVIAPSDIALFKIPLNEPDPTPTLVSELEFGSNGADQSMLLVGSQLYIGIEAPDHLVLKLDLAQSLPIDAQIMISDYPGAPLGLAFKDGTFYGSEGFSYTLVNFEDPNLSITENGVNEITLYPNPSSGRVFLQGQSTEVETFRLYSASGQLLTNGVYLSEGIDLSGLPNGLYFLEHTGEQGSIVKRVLKN